MNYEKKYKEALERARDMMSYKEVRREDMEYLFPELKENENEKIRKQIISFLKEFEYDHYRSLNFSSWIAWLEKQGEQKSSWSEEDESSFLGALWCCKKAASIAKDENEMGTVWCAERWLKSLKDRYTWKPTEKQGEQKPFDYENANIQQKDFATVKTKFNKGDWIVNHYNHVACIESIDEKHYVLSCDDGSRERWSFMYIDRNWHLWTIQDAKDGDVLCTYECNKPKIVFILKENPIVFILKGTSRKHYVFNYHCYYNIMYPCFESNFKTGCLAPNKEDVKPATEEQRNLLFQKMKEFGYEWDANKKELINL